MARIKLALVGAGNMGSSHLKDLSKSSSFELVGIADIDEAKLAAHNKAYDVKGFTDFNELFDKTGCEAVVIATPHYQHTTVAIEAFSRGMHVLTEKPVGVHVKDVEKMTTAYNEAKKKKPDLVYAAMFQQRTLGYWRKIKELISDGELGKLVRTTWIITDWFRTQFYYDNGGWRATWKGEGGGVLLNQCPHNLDLYQWLVGMPATVHGFASFGKYHRIEVEDEVTAYMEHADGMVGHFITTTGESPGTNRLEIVGENGKLVFENGELVFFRNRHSMVKQINESQKGFDKVENWKITVPYSSHGESGHRIVLENFADTINGTAELIAPAPEGVHSVGLSNAMLLSVAKKKPVSIPLDGDEFEAVLNDLIKNSTFTKDESDPGRAGDLSKSF